MVAQSTRFRGAWILVCVALFAFAYRDWVGQVLMGQAWQSDSAPSAFGLWGDDWAIREDVDESTWSELGGRFDPVGFAESSEPHFRPGTALLAKGLFTTLGGHERLLVVAGLAFHLLIALSVGLWVRRTTGSAIAALVASSFLACSAAPQEAVGWFAGALHTLPAGATLLALALVLHRGKLRAGRRVALAVAICLVSATLREAFYVAPLMIASAGLCLDRSRAERRTYLLTALGVLALCVLHFFALTKVPVESNSSLADRLHSLGRVAGGALTDTLALDSLVDRPRFHFVALGAAFASAVGLVLTRGSTRFFIAWSSVALFPYALTLMGERHTWFLHLPLAVVLGIAASDRRWILRAPVLAAFAVWLAANVGWRVPERIAVYSNRAQQARSIDAWLAREAPTWNGIRRLVVDRIPPGALNAVAPMAAGHGIDDLQVFETVGIPSGPYAVCLVALPPSSPSTVFARYDGPSGGYSQVTRSELFGPLIPRPMFEFADAVERVDSTLEADQRTILEIRSRDQAGDTPGGDQRRTAFLAADPNTDLPLGGPGKFLSMSSDPSLTLTLQVEVTGSATILLYTAPLPGMDLRVEVDGDQIAPLPAGSWTVGLPLAPGRHRLLLASTPRD